MVTFTVHKLCWKCNKEFELKRIEHNGMLRQSITNMEDCAHCGARNDTWLAIDWPKENEDESFRT